MSCWVHFCIFCNFLYVISSFFKHFDIERVPNKFIINFCNRMACCHCWDKKLFIFLNIWNLGLKSKKFVLPNKSITRDFKTLFCKCASFIEHHYWHSTSNINSLRSYTKYLLLFESIKSYEHSYWQCCRQKWRNDDRKEIYKFDDDFIKRNDFDLLRKSDQESNNS